MVAVIQDLILQLHAVSKPWEGTAIVTFIVTDTMTAVQICMRLTASVSFNTYAIPCSQAGISGCTEVFRLVDTKFANSADLNLCSLNLRPLHLYDSIFCSLEFISHIHKFYWSTNLKTSVPISTKKKQKKKQHLL